MSYIKTPLRSADPPSLRQTLNTEELLAPKMSTAATVQVDASGEVCVKKEANFVQSDASGEVCVKKEAYGELRSDLTNKLILSATAFAEASNLFTNKKILTQQEMIHIIWDMEFFEETTAQENLELGQVQKYKELMNRKKLLLDMKLYYFKRMNQLRKRFAPLVAKYVKLYDNRINESLDAATKNRVEERLAKLKDIQKHL
jgi:hypothetical protein